MKQIALRERIEFPNKPINIYNNKVTLLPNQLYLHLCSNRRIIRHVIDELYKHQQATTYTISCMDGSIQSNSIVQTFTQLLIKLRQIANGDFEFNDQVVNTILIHNLTAFYWDLIIVDKFNYQQLGFDNILRPPQFYYLNLFRILQVIVTKYNCNVVVTAYDIVFNNGIKENIAPVRDTSLQRYTKLDPSFVLHFDQILHIDNIQALQSFNKQTAQWIDINAS
ncbi:uncharacterized protein J8A68_004115 [[Candida] subhashii]|uniref:Uncharacterized protein n=1 Tax=[Candida] subhashii TaxID=561895 RepID=A0A8J5UXG7_9ASCO|nr:uncharacterized protein J8A68_004115 [[Candida] subhashii]KAG7662344.1 hypothetical protein J8A68_004115 [[Candida] subhashii]